MSEAKPTALLPEQEAYNDGVEAAKSVIRGEVFNDSDTADYIIPCLLTAIARKVNIYSYTRAQSPAQAEWLQIESCPTTDRRLIWIWREGMDIPQIAYTDTWWQAGFSSGLKPTHWMDIPVPQPPKEQQ